MNDVNKHQFNHIKIHTQYSICEGALRTADLANYCKTNKVHAVGLCDSYNLCGALEFSETIAKSKTQPIIGSQINIKYKDNYGKLPLFAKNLIGYKNLIKLSSKSFLEIKENEDPHCTIKDIIDSSEGLISIKICLTLCLLGKEGILSLYVLKKSSTSGLVISIPLVKSPVYFSAINFPSISSL